MIHENRQTADEAVGIAAVAAPTLPEKYLENLLDDIYATIMKYTSDGYMEADIYFHIDDFITYTQRRYILFRIEHTLKKDGYMIEKVYNDPDGAFIMHVSFKDATYNFRNLISRNLMVILGIIGIVAIIYAVVNA